MKDSQSHRCGEASADAEVFAGQDAEPSAVHRAQAANKNLALALYEKDLAAAVADHIKVMLEDVIPAIMEDERKSALAIQALAIAAWNRRAEPGWQPISSAPRDGTLVEPSAAWRARPGKRQGDPAGFVRLVQDNPGFWLRDFALKYRTLTIDTREPTAFWLADRDGKAIDPRRVLDAIAATPAHAELSPGNSPNGQGEAQPYGVTRPSDGSGA